MTPLRESERRLHTGSARHDASRCGSFADRECRECDWTGLVRLYLTMTGRGWVCPSCLTPSSAWGIAGAA